MFAQLVCSITQIKAIHVEVDSKLLALQCQSIASMYSSHMQVFPSLAIKMHFVPEFNVTSNHHTHTQVLALQARQARFLARTGTRRMCTPSNCNLNTSQMIDLLGVALQKYPYFNQTTTPIHAVSPMVRIKGFIIRYLPQHCSIIQEILAQILESLPGFYLTSVQSISQPRRHPTTAGDSKQLFPTKTHPIIATTEA